MSENTIYQTQTLLQEASLANLTAWQESEKPAQMIETCGASSPVSFARLSPAGSWLKMSQGYLQARMDGSFVEFLGTFPQAGMMLNGIAYRLRRLVRRISARGSLLLPTLRAKESGDYQYSHGDHGKKVLTLTGAAKIYPTLTARDYRSSHAPNSEAFKNRQKHSRGVPLVEELQRENGGIGGQLNPEWAEWFMGFPKGWTELKDSETP
jgi:hypothetical protein